MDVIDWRAEGDRCVALLQDLLRIPTVNRGTNEPGDGNERPAAERIADFLREAKVEPRLFEKTAGRTNLVARVKGTGEKGPLLLNAHLDVVEADASRWRHPPFSGEIHGGYLWGRGAIDMKHMAAMSACVLALLARRGAPLARDVILAAVADEEAACNQGSLFLVDEHPDEVRAEYMLGEIGAFSMNLFGRTFYPIQVAEKGLVWMRATVQGEPGHGSMPDPDSAVVKLARAITRLADDPLPLHACDPTRHFLAALAAHLPRPMALLLPRLADPRVGPTLLKHAIRDPAQRRQFTALLSNTAAPTVLRAGSKVNVIPGEATVELDGRTLPGQTSDDLLRELHDRFGPGVDIEVLRTDPPTTSDPAHPLFAHLADILRAHDPGGIPVPYVIPGFTDAKAFTRLGTTYYGFTPVRFDPSHGVVFSRLYHGNDERIPV